MVYVPPEKTEIYRYKYTMKLHEAIKNLSTRFFGRRRGAINIDTLDTIHTEIIRLPIDFRVRVRKLKVKGSAAENYEALKQILAKSSFPLGTLFMYRGLQSPESCVHPTLQSAQKLTLFYNRPDVQNYLEMFLILRNPIIEVHMHHWSFPIADQITLIRDWLQTGRAVGSRLTYPLWQDGIGRALMNQINENIASAVVDDMFATIPMPSSRQLIVKCYEEKIRWGPDWFETKCTVAMRVVEAE